VASGAGAKRPAAVRVQPYRWRPSASFIAHLFKAASKQHHRRLIPVLARLLPEDAVVFDVGAHAGQYTKLFARIAGRGRVYAFEPQTYARSILRTVVWLHGLANVAILPMALGAAPGIVIMTVPVKRRRSFAFGLAHLGAPEARWQVLANEPVALTTLDMAVAALALDRLDFVKADIEGWELQLLRGAEASLRRFRPRLFVEISEAHLARAGDRCRDLVAYLAGLGYGAFALDPKGALVPAASPGDGDFWFLAGDDPARALLAP
jgi:FkbM family methyltransferase